MRLSLALERRPVTALRPGLHGRLTVASLRLRVLPRFRLRYRMLRSLDCLPVVLECSSGDLRSFTMRLHGGKLIDGLGDWEDGGILVTKANNCSVVP